jgi:hypothetical protein
VVVRINVLIFCDGKAGKEGRQAPFADSSKGFINAMEYLTRQASSSLSGVNMKLLGWRTS